MRKKRNADQMRRRYQTDPEYRAALLAKAARRWRDDPEHRAKRTAADTAAAARRYRDDPQFRAKHIAEATASQRRRRNSSADQRNRHHARVIARNAITSGQLKPLPCIVCGEPQTTGHHADYSQPLAVIWLCRAHHRQLHREHSRYLIDKHGVNFHRDSRDMTPMNEEEERANRAQLRLWTEPEEAPGLVWTAPTAQPQEAAAPPTGRADMKNERAA